MNYSDIVQPESDTLQYQNVNSSIGSLSDAITLNRKMFNMAQKIRLVLLGLSVLLLKDFVLPFQLTSS